MEREARAEPSHARAAEGGRWKGVRLLHTHTHTFFDHDIRRVCATGKTRHDIETPMTSTVRFISLLQNTKRDTNNEEKRKIGSELGAVM